MIPRPSLRPSIFFLSLSLSTMLTQADRVHFNDGRPPKEGKVVFNTPSVVELKWEKRPGIFQTDRFLKANIERVEIDTKEDIQFRNMGQLLPTPDRLTPEDYQRRIVKCKAFLDLFPNGSHASKVELILTTLEEENEKAVAGGLKLQNKWISPEERRRDSYGIDAGLEYADMVTAKESSDLKMALRHFENIQSDFSGSIHYAKASALAIETMKSYQPILQKRIAQVQFKRQDRERARATLPANVRAQNKAAQDKTDATYLKLVARETNELKTKWLTLNEYHSDPMRKVLNTLKNTLSTLEKETPAEDSSFADSLHQDAWDAVSRGDLEAVEEILRELKSLKVPERYLALLQEASETKEENEQPLPTGEEAGDENKPEEEEAATEQPAEEIETKAKKETTSKTPSKKPTKSSPSASVSSADQDSGTSKVQVIFVVVLIVVIVGALGAAFLGRKKK
ncbi:MAG: PTPDL family protein [Roseibacillus sp.]